MAQRKHLSNNFEDRMEDLTDELNKGEFTSSEPETLERSRDYNFDLDNDPDIKQLDEKYHGYHKSGRFVLDSKNISPSERIKRYIEMVDQEKGNVKEAYEYAKKYLRDQGENIAGQWANKEI